MITRSLSDSLTVFAIALSAFCYQKKNRETVLFCVLNLPISNLQFPYRIAERPVDIANGIGRHHHTLRPATYPLRGNDDLAARPLNRTPIPA